LLYRLAPHVEMTPDSVHWNARYEIVAAPSFSPAISAIAAYAAVAPDRKPFVLWLS
jgi:hypothetical protein